MKQVLVLMVVLIASPAFAAPLQVPNGEGLALEVELKWQSPVDLDLFLTDPNGETVYFANRMAKSGAKMGQESGCAQLTEAGPFRETAKIPKAMLGRYRVSVDFIKDCGSKALSADFETILRGPNGRELGRGASKVQYRLLNPVGWEFEVK
jgi:hypothetical protein